MSAPLFTASGAERAAMCPASCALPVTSSTSSYAERGVDGHAFIRRVLVGTPRETALALVSPKLRPTCAAIDFGDICADLSGILAEPAYAYNVRTRKARFIGTNIGRHYGPRDPWEVCGTSDVVGLDSRKRPVTWDTKMGHQLVTPIPENWQVRFFGLVLRDLHDAPEVEGRIGYVKPSGRVVREMNTLDAFALDDFADQLEEAAVRVVEARKDFADGKHLRMVEGPWCKYCDSVTACPAKTKLVRAMHPDLAELVGAQLADMTADQLGVVYLKVREAKTNLEFIDNGLKACAERMEFELPDGRHVKLGTREVERFDAEAARAMLLAKGATAEEMASLFETKEESAGLRVVGSAATKKKGRAA